MEKQGSLLLFDLLWALFFAALATLGIASFKAWFLKGRSRENPANWPVLGMLPALLLNLHHIYDYGAYILINNGGSFMFHGPWFGSMRYFITADPRNVEHALRTRFSNYPKGTDFSEIFNELLGSSIVNVDGHLWQMQRRIVSILINSRTSKQFSESTVVEMVEDKLFPTLQHFCAASSHVDLQDILLRFTLDTICMMGLGVDTGCISPSLPEVPFVKALEHALECTVLRFFLPPRWWKVRRWLCLGMERSMQDAVRVVNGFCDKVIAEMKDQHENGLSQSKPTILSGFLTNTDFDDKHLRELGLSLLLAGRDTTALTLCWFLWLLAKHPNVEQRVVEESRRVIGTAKKDGKHFLTRAELNQMHYLHAALTETLRLYPSIPVDFKHIVADDVFPDGTCVKKGDKFIYDIHAMGRMESIWGKDCAVFRPERWLDPSDGTFTDAHIPTFHYMAFNAGPRKCLGKDIAYLIMKAVASTLLFHFKVVLVPGHKVEPKLSITLYMKEGFLVTLQSREIILP